MTAGLQPGAPREGTLLRMRRALIAVIVALAVFPATAAAQEEPRIPPGAKAAGLDVGNLLLSEAAAVLDQHFGAVMRQTVEVRVAGRGLRAPMKSIDFAFDPLRTARRANIAARATPPAPDGSRPVDVPLYVTWNADKLTAFATKVDRRTRIRARNARLKITLRRLIRRKARVGWSIDAAALKTTIEQALQNPAVPRALRAQRERVHPKINVADLRKRYATVVTIDRAHFKLRLFKRLKHSETYDIAVGLPDYPTPTGRYSITNKAVNPAWSAPDQPWAGAYRNEVVAGGAPENPLKARWLGITGGVGIHGTGAEYSIGTRASHGCIRMRVGDVIDLYPRVPVGSAVLIR
jgi:lipoprotein-anchoring transpeptidase ErfK/SrfK